MNDAETRSLVAAEDHQSYSPNRRMLRQPLTEREQQLIRLGDKLASYVADGIVAISPGFEGYVPEMREAIDNWHALLDSDAWSEPANH